MAKTLVKQEVITQVFSSHTSSTDQECSHHIPSLSRRDETVDFQRKNTITGDFKNVVQKDENEVKFYKAIE